MSGVAPGTVLGGRYRLTEHIAGGGMGDVWRCIDDVLARTVAVKVLLPSLVADPGFAARFRDEARTMATINHPGVVDIYDYGTDNGVTYLVMEYVEGDALSKTLSRVGRLTPQRTMSLIAQAADALHAAHDNGIVHRDVKPANLLVRPNGTLVLTDFGIARREAANQNLTAAGSVLGTASYISPEQATGRGATPLSDVYALGVVAYQCLAGRRPFEGGTPIEIAYQHVDAVPPPLPPDIPPAVRALVDRCLAKPPGARYPSAAALASAARALGGGESPTTQAIRQAQAPTQPISPGAAGATRPMTRTQVMAPQAQPRQQPYPQYRPVPAEAQRSPAGKVILLVILAILVLLVSAFAASLIKRQVYANRSLPVSPAVRVVAAEGATWRGATSRAAAGSAASGDAARSPAAGSAGQIRIDGTATVDPDQSSDHAMTEGLTR